MSGLLSDLGVVGVVRRVVRAPAAALSRAGQTVDPTAPETVQLAADLLATMAVSPGCVGLAAPQVGVSAQVFTVDVTGHPKARSCQGAFVLCNARVVEASQWRVGREVVAGQLPGSGEEVELVTDAFEARAVQHEVDHCEGLLFLDRVRGAHAIYPRKVYL